jgi:hypothetical protein
MFPFLLSGNPIHEIVEGIYLGGVWNAMTFAESQSDRDKHGINAIVNLMGDLETYLQTETKQKSVSYDDYVCTPIHSWFQLRNKSSKIIHWMKEKREQGKKILVHCFEGRVRSVTLVIMYLMYVHKLSLQEARALVKEKHPDASDGFELLCIWKPEEVDEC